ncbi:hypothetical protein C1645_745553 [Glomus cerebriforme]|uniref:Uncharacterized protein n=1 Tax=Glomus cerebriforme TaxID=658196 RepID=A0A397S206_9GLOM|nr:hypothetical protein C1645_745553 [Glomus cerebriforme]
MSKVINTINNNNDNISKQLESAFPDPTEDIFWQKTDAIWNPNKKELNKQQNDQENNDFVIAPPPVTNNFTRHSRKSSRVSWGLQTDSERHVELLETKLNDVISNPRRTHTRSSTMDFDGTPLSTLGYYPEEEIGSGTIFDDEEEHPDNHNPQESDEGLWLLWKNQSNNENGEQYDDTSTTNQSWYLPILPRSDNNNVVNNNNTLPRLPRMRSAGYVTNYRDDPNEFSFYDDDEEDGYDLNDEILLNRAKRKREKEYLKFDARSYECCGCNTTNGLCAGLWGGWCCNWRLEPDLKNKSGFILTYNISGSFKSFGFISGFIRFSFGYPDIINPVSFVPSGFIIFGFLRYSDLNPNRRKPDLNPNVGYRF